MKIVIEDYKLPSWNMMYAGMHWTKRRQIVKDARSYITFAVHTVIDQSDIPFRHPVTIDYEIHYKDKRRRDPDNACIKILTDGIVQEGIPVDDSYEQITQITIRMRGGQESDKIIITIEEAK